MNHSIKINKKDIDIKKVYVIISSIHLMVLGLILCAKLGYNVTFFRQTVCVIYLTFIPGSLIIRCFNMNFSITKYLLYSIGMSLFFLMVIGFLVNATYPIIGIDEPISENSILITILVLTTLLLIFNYTKNKKIKIYTLSNSNTNYMFLLFLLFVVLLGVFSALFLKKYSNNDMTIFFYGLLAIMPFIILNTKNANYPISIWVISISLLFSVALSCEYVSFYMSDAARELYYAKTVLNSGFWDITKPSCSNAMLRIVILHPIYSIFSNMDLRYVFLVVHPFIYSFVPVVLYITYKNLFTSKIAFLSVFYFMSIYTFFVILSKNTRTGIAELFIALLLMCLLDKNINNITKKIFIIIFSFSLIFTHYGTAYIFILALFISFIIYYIINKKNVQPSPSIISNVFIILLIAFTYVWYVYISNSTTLLSLVSFFDNFIVKINNFISAKESYTLYAITKNWPLSIDIIKYIIMFFNIMIAIGLLYVLCNLWRKRNFFLKTNLTNEFVALSVSFCCIVVATLLPIKIFNFARVYHISLLFLVPFTIYGFVIFSSLIFRKNKSILLKNNFIHIITLVLSIFFLFNCGFMSETIINGNDYSPNWCMFEERSSSINEAQFVYSYYSAIYNKYDVMCARWLINNRSKMHKIYMDYAGVYGEFIKNDKPLKHLDYLVFTKDNITINQGYMLLQKYNNIRNVSIVDNYPPEIDSFKNNYPIENSNIIYSNNLSKVYFKNRNY